ncbi:MAG: ATP-binding protein [Desulfobacterales bacterium]
MKRLSGKPGSLTKGNKMGLNLLKILNENFRIKIFAAIIFFIFLISASFTSLFIHNQIKTLKDNLIKEGKVLASVLAYNSRIGVFSENKELLEGPAEGIFQQGDVLEVLVFNPDGVLLKSKKRPGKRISEKSTEEDELVRRKIFEKLKKSILPFYIEEKNHIEFWTPVISSSGHLMEESMFFVKDPLQRNDRLIGFVKITMDKEILYKQFNDILHKSILMGIIFLMIGSGATYIVVKGITKPLNRLTESVKIFGMEGVVEEVPVETEDEIGELAKAFNNMADSLKGREAALRESETRYRTLFENMVEGFAYCRILFEDGQPQDFVCLVVNDAFQTLTGFKDVAGKKVSEVIPGIRKTDPELFERFARVALTGLSERFEFYINAMDMWFNLSVYSPEKEFFVVVSDDITERKRTEEELLKAKKLESLGILAGGIAHDFNNILTAISGNISLAKMDVDSDSKIFDFLNAAELASVRAQALTMQLLTFAKGGTPVKEISSIASILKESSLFVLTGSKSKCEFSIAENLWSVEADPGQISRVINNIVINANQAMPEGGVIQIRAWNKEIEKEHGLPVKPGRYIMITIKDQGVGIAENNLSKIFDPYFSTKQTGRGLGLASAYSIIKKHHGHISVNSGQDKGTIFTIYLPASGKEIPVKEEPARLTGEGRILIMDDDKYLTEMMGDMLEILGYEAEFANDGAEAVALYKKGMESGKPYDAVILDLTVPGSMGGKDVIKILHEIDPKVKAIVSSGYSDDPVMSDFGEFGFKGMMPKPFDANVLGKVLNDVIKTTN